MENETRDPWGAENLSGQPSSQPPQWGASAQQTEGDPFHRRYAGLLRVLTYLLSFGVSGLAFIITVVLTPDDAGIHIIALFSCLFLGAVLWVTWSYVAKLFDLVSKLAQSNDELLRLRKGEKNI